MAPNVLKRNAYLSLTGLYLQYSEEHQALPDWLGRLIVQ